jgi:hypothetical protein
MNELLDYCFYCDEILDLNTGLCPNGCSDYIWRENLEDIIPGRDYVEEDD